MRINAVTGPDFAILDTSSQPHLTCTTVIYIAFFLHPYHACTAFEAYGFRDDASSIAKAKKENILKKKKLK